MVLPVLIKFKNIEFFLQNSNLYAFFVPIYPICFRKKYIDAKAKETFPL